MASIKTISKMVSIINNLVMFFDLIIPTLIINDFALSLKIINVIQPFDYVLYIYYLMRFKKKQAKILVLFNFRNKVKIMHLVYMAKLSFKVSSTNV